MPKPSTATAAVQSTPKPKKRSEAMVDKAETAVTALSLGDKEDTEVSVTKASENDSKVENKEPTSPRKDASTDPIELSGDTDNAGRPVHSCLGANFVCVPDNLIKKDDLKDLLECPVCLRVPRSSPIFQVRHVSLTPLVITSRLQCARGHVVCGECRPNVSTCPQCRDPLGNIRSLISEKMLEKLPCVCKFTDQGCQVESFFTAPLSLKSGLL